ncbi:uncharacterized mitochondrial protein-like protein [Tanacetum coccineum]
MDLCGPMRIQSINGRKYILVIVDDYSRFTWVKFLRSKDEVPEFVIKFLKMIQVRLNATVCNIRTDNGIEFVNQTQRAYYEEVKISHQTFVARTPQQNDVVERRNHTLLEAARTMLIFSKALLFLWAEVLSTKRVKISSTNVRLETTMQQKEETFQVVIDVIKNSTCFKAFIITAECIVDAEVFKKIPDICPRVKGEEFTEVQDDDATLTFFIDLGFKGPLHKYTNMYVDHMHQPWRILAAIINKCLSEKIIDHRKERKSRRKTMPFPRFTKVIINHFLSQHKSLSNLKFQHYYTIKDDGIVSRLKFVRNGEDYQEYELPIPDMMLNDAIKRSKFYQMFLKYSTGQIPPKKSKGKGSQGKKTADTPVADVDVSEESDHQDLKIEEEVYVCQPPGFEDPNFPKRVYKVEKALYGLHQAPRAWYETLLTYLLDNGFQRGKIDKTLFIKKDKGDILLVQVYVDDITFGSTKKSLCIEFKKMMHKKFQMSSMGELTFFLGLQVKQKEDGIFISQDKYVTDVLKKFGFTDVKTASTPMETQKPLLKDEDGKEVNVHLYRSMIGSLMYLMSSRPDIMFPVCACARYQVNPKVSHLHAVKRIFRYLKGQPKLGLWYPKDSPFYLVAYTDSDYAGASLDRKSTIGGCQFFRCRLISWQCKKQTMVANSTIKAEYAVVLSLCGQVL